LIRRPVGIALATAAAILATSALAKYLQSAGALDPETGKRMVQVVIGLGLAVWGNYMPKRFGVGGANACASSRACSAVRVGGWAMTLAGLTHAVLWASAPLPVADAIATTAVVSALMVTLTYGLWTLWRCRPRPRNNASA
jgi:hypothetical protein